jgi:serine/threonine protein phosphatase PrpC
LALGPGKRASAGLATLDNEAPAVGKHHLVVEFSTPMASDERHPRIRQRNAMRTDVGVIRDHNEDTAYVDPDGDFFIVADGMGGHAAGEVASKMAVDAVAAALQGARKEVADFARAPSDVGRRALVSALENAVRQAHQSVYQRGVAESDKQGMGTTLDVVLVAGSEAFVAHVGDSRTYLVRDRRAAQITTDHTVAEVLVIEGKLSIEEAQISPLRTILVNAIGVAPDVGVEMAHVRLRTGDRLLVCSDGLHDYFPLEQEVSDYISENEPDQALSKMITVAKSRGGHDNITGIVLEVLETLDVPAPDDDSGDESARPVGYEDTGSLPVVADPDAVPAETPRDDTAPVPDGASAAGSNGSAPAAKQVGADGKLARPAKHAEEDEKESGKPGKEPARSSPAPGQPSGSGSHKPSGGSSQSPVPGEDEEAKEKGANSAGDEEDADADSGRKAPRKSGRGKPDVKTRGRDRKEIEGADTDELPTEPGDEDARTPRSRSE